MGSIYPLCHKIVHNAEIGHRKMQYAKQLQDALAFEVHCNYASPCDLVKCLIAVVTRPLSMVTSP